MKYAGKRQRSKSYEFYEKITAKPENAKNITVPIGPEKIPTNLYEYARYKLLSSRNTESLENFIKEFPDSRYKKYSYMLLANYYVTSPNVDIDKAEKFFSEMLELYPEDSNLLTYYILYCSSNKRNLDEAEKLAQKVIDARFVSWNNPFNNLARVLAAKGDSMNLDLKYGVKYLEQRKRKFLGELNMYARFWMRRNDYLESAIDALELAHKLDPEDSQVRSTLADFYVKNNYFDKALDIYGHDYIITQTDKPWLLSNYMYFWALKHGKNLESCGEMALHFIKENEPGTWNRERAAEVLMKLGKVESALQAFGEAFIKDHWNTNANTLNSYAWFWAEQGMNLEHALKASLRSI